MIEFRTFFSKTFSSGIITGKKLAVTVRKVSNKLRFILSLIRVEKDTVGISCSRHKILKNIRNHSIFGVNFKTNVFLRDLQTMWTKNCEYICSCLRWLSVHIRSVDINILFFVLFRFKMTIRPAYRPKIVKKRTKRFIRHQSDRYAKLAVSTGHFRYYLHDLNLTSIWITAKLA